VAEDGKGEMRMGERLDEKETVTFKELLMANAIQVDALCQILIEKSVFTEEEFFRKLKQVQKEYEGKKAIAI
jgi:hypothetical protein